MSDGGATAEVGGRRGSSQEDGGTAGGKDWAPRRLRSVRPGPGATRPQA